MVPVDDTTAEVVTVIVAAVKSSGTTDPDVRLKITDPSWVEDWRRASICASDTAASRLFGLTTAEKVVINVLDEQRIDPLSVGESNCGSSVSVYHSGSAVVVVGHFRVERTISRHENNTGNSRAMSSPIRAASSAQHGTAGLCKTQLTEPRAKVVRMTEWRKQKTQGTEAGQWWVVRNDQRATSYDATVRVAVIQAYQPHTTCTEPSSPAATSRCSVLIVIKKVVGLLRWQRGKVCSWPENAMVFFGE